MLHTCMQKSPRTVQQNSINAGGCLRSTRALLAGVSAQYFRTLKPLCTPLFATDELMFRSWFLGTSLWLLLNAMNRPALQGCQ